MLEYAKVLIPIAIAVVAYYVLVEIVKALRHKTSIQGAVARGVGLSIWPNLTGLAAVLAIPYRDRILAYITPVWIVVVGLILGSLLYSIRARWRAFYGGLEIVFAIVSLSWIGIGMKDQPPVQSGLAFCAAIYVFIRGRVNMEEATTKAAA